MARTGDWPEGPIAVPSIGTYSELKEAVKQWSLRPDLSTRIPTFIGLAHTDIERGLKETKRDRTYSATLASGETDFTLPVDFVSAHAVTADGLPVLPKFREAFKDADRSYTSVRIPRAYRRRGDIMEFAPAPNADVTIEIDYIGRLTALDDDVQENWVLTEEPGLYLYGALTHLAGYVRDLQRIAIWEAAFAKILNSVNEAYLERRYAGGQLRRPRRFYQ